MNRHVDEIVVIGCGVVGLPFAVALATRGHRVVGVDVDAQRVATLRAGNGGVQETALASELAATLATEQLRFETELKSSHTLRTYVVAVPTPATVDGTLDRAALDAAVAAIARVIRSGELVMVRSTVPIGTSRAIAARLASTERPVRVASTPDRSLTGRSYADQFEVPHIVGGVCPDAADAATVFLQSLGQVLDAGSADAAEAIKLFANVQRDVTFALANELAMICDTLDLDFHRIRALGSQNYERFSVARPGPVGGPCLTKDVHLLADSLAAGQSPQLGLTGRSVNASVVDHIVNRLECFLDDTRIDALTLAVLGLAFKGFPVTGEQRGSFALSLIEKVRARHPQAQIRAWDPGSNAAMPTLENVVRGAHVVVVATEHPRLNTLDLNETAALMARPGMIVDLWGGARAAHTVPRSVAYYAFGAGNPISAVG